MTALTSILVANHIIKSTGLIAGRESTRERIIGHLINKDGIRSVAKYHGIESVYTNEAHRFRYRIYRHCCYQLHMKVSNQIG